MSAGWLAAQVMLWLGIAIEVVCCVGVWWMHDAFDRLHYAAAASTVGAVLIGASAVVTGAGSLAGTVQVAAAVGVLLLLNPVLAHATGRAARRLRYDDLGPDPEDSEETS